MRYIKQFESFSNESDGELYTPITYDKFESLISLGDIEEISDADFDHIKYLIDLEDPSTITKYEKVNRFHFDKVKSVALFDINFGQKNRIGYILFYKFTDEWWLIEMCTNGKYDWSDSKVRTWLVDSMYGIEKWVDVELAAIKKTRKPANRSR